MTPEQQTGDQASIDEAVEESFQASDPPAFGKVAADQAGVAGAEPSNPGNPPDTTPYPFPTSESMEHDSPKPVGESDVVARNPGVEQSPGYPVQEAADEDARSAPDAADRDTTRWPEPGSIHAPFSNGLRTDQVGFEEPPAKLPTPPDGAGTEADKGHEA